VSGRPDVTSELSRLKDFQKATVETVFRRMYLDPDPAYRFLVADEVGLGKTLVAKGLIAKVVDHLWDDVDRIDIVYICSNSNIARQNISRLQLSGHDSANISSRITLLPLKSSELDTKLNIIFLTPGTSLNIGNSTGTVEERALLLFLLEKQYGLQRNLYLYTMCCGANRETLAREMDLLDANTSIDLSMLEQFCERIEPKILPELRAVQQEFGRKTKPSKELSRRRNAVIGDLRKALAAVCIDLLEPDLVILDEFQRFKPLLQGEGDAGELARQLFDYSSRESNVRLILLSATPYRMYGSSDDGTEEHYDDFMATMEFLLASADRLDELKAIVAAYRNALIRAPVHGLTPLQPLAIELSRLLRSVMVRTERIGVDDDRSGMLREVECAGIGLRPGELRSYRGLVRTSRLLGASDPIEYWKSAPWALSFMDTYKLRLKLTDRVDAGDPDVLSVLREHSGMMLDIERAATMNSLDAASGKVEWLIQRTVGSEMWKLLWLPPAMPYYELGAPFKDVPSGAMTKQLIFSAWQVVPRALAAALSHEADIRALSSLPRDFDEDESLDRLRKRVGNKLGFEQDGGRPGRMAHTTLLYPSPTLAKFGDPLELARADHTTIEQMLQAIRQRLRPAIERLGLPQPESGRIDNDWYWAIPILLDRSADPRALDSLMNSDALDLMAIDHDSEQSTDNLTGWDAHVARIREVAEEGWTPSGPPPPDLEEVLALNCLGGPAITALRTLSQAYGAGGTLAAGVCGQACNVAWALRRLYNLPEVTGVVAATFDAEPYWQQVLRYGVSGCLQAVLEEFGHMVLDDEAKRTAHPIERVFAIADRLTAALGFRRASVTGHRWRVARNGRVVPESQQIQTRFAVRFGEEKGTDTDGTPQRADDVRAAFNSPFWPFVLITTSVGQEGLDFHWYSHSVVHWNLPNNPVDLEQREGRVHRYKGHAIRRNVAKRWGAAAVASGSADPWTHAFDAACADRSPGQNELVPFWMYPLDGAVKVERHVPCYPLSRDTGRLARLRNALVVYRMVFGQARQEELLGFLQDQMPTEELARVSREFSVDLSPQAQSSITHATG
jgi:hypothetical protein